MVNQSNIISREELIMEYVQLMRSGNATLFIGAGLSMDSGYPSWNELLRRSAVKLGLDINNIKGYDYYDLTDWYCQFNSDRATLIQNLVYELSLPKELSINHQIIARLPLSKVWTSNFDKLIETAFRKQGRATRVIKRDKDFPFSEHEEVKIYKVHGCIGIPDDVVITRDDINNYYRKYEVMSHAFFSALAQDCFLFLGFGFQDENFKTIIGRISANYQDLTKRHFAVLKRPALEEEQKIFYYAINNLSRKGIKVCVIDSHEEIPILLKDIEKTYIRNNVFIAGSFDKDFPLRKPDFPKFEFTDINEENGNPKQQTSTLDSKTEEYIENRKKEIAEAIFPYHDPQEIVVHFLERLGEELMDRNLTLYTGFGQGVCDVVIEGASKKFVKKDVYQSIVNKLKIFPLPHKHNIENYHNQFYRENMVGACGFVILTRGATQASDYTSGSFEEYNIAKGLSNLLTGKQKSIFQEIRRFAESQSNGERLPLKTRFLSSQHIENLKKAPENKIAGLCLQQAQLVYYKCEEQIEIFYRLLYEQWKLAIRSLDACKYRIDILFKKCKEDEIKEKWDVIKIKLERLVYNRADFFYSQFARQYLDLDHDFDYKALEDLFTSLNDFKKETKNSFGSKKEQNILKTLLNAIKKLLEGDFKYLILHFFIYSLDKIEYEYLSHKFSEEESTRKNSSALAQEYIEQYKSFLGFLLEFPLTNDDADKEYPSFFYYNKNDEDKKELHTLFVEGMNELNIKMVLPGKDPDKSTKEVVKIYTDRIYETYKDDVPVSITENPDHRKYLICKIQFYKYVYLLCNFEKSFRRLETNQQIVDINKPDIKNLDLQHSLSQGKTDQIHSEGPTHSTKLNTDPLLYFPNDLRSYLDLHKKYFYHFNSNYKILRNMIGFKRSIELLKNKDYDNHTYFNICRHLEEIDKIESDSNLPYKSNPYRPSTVVIPIGTFGGMARKVWKEERIRFDYLCSSPDFDAKENENEKRTVREKLLACYYKIFTIDFSRKEKWNDEELEQHYIELLQSIFYIIEKSKVPPPKKKHV